MKSIIFVVVTAIWVLVCGPLYANGLHNDVSVPNKEYIQPIADLSKEQRDTLINAVQKGSAAWIEGFNRGDAEACANAYEVNSIMTAKPFGTFTGRKNIQSFWENLISQGYAKVRYIEPKVEAINANTAVVSSKWEMNKAYGIITKEVWVLQENGQAKLMIDDFEVLGNK